MTKQVAIYARVSTKDQDCSRQTHELEAWAARMGWTVVERMAETGSGANVDRLLRARVMHGVRAGHYTAVLVTEPSRWSRSVTDLLSSLQDLAAHNASLLTLNGLSMDMSTPTGRLLVSIMGGVAEFERDLIRERVTSGIAAAKRRGVQIGRKQGSKNSGYRHDDAVAKLYESGMRPSGIAATLQISLNTVKTALKRIAA